MPKPPGQLAKYKFHNVRVLYVEDEAESREKLLRVLNRRFSDIHVALDGEEGYELYHRLLPDLIITDIKMNQLSGLNMIEKIREHSDKVQIIVTTAHDDNEFFIQSIENNVNHFILKPIDLNKFHQAIQKSVYEVQLEKELEKQKKLTRAILDFQENLIFVVENNSIVEYNHAFSNFTGYKKENPCPKACSLISLFSEEDVYYYPDTKEEWIEEFLAKEKGTAKVSWRGKNGRKAVFILKAAEITQQGQILFVCTDITELEKESKKNALLAMIDPLTNIFNRLKFDEIFTSEFRRAERYGHSFSLIMFDIDFFKRVNDQYGHQRGDEVLTTLSTIVQQRIRECDILARWGGEEFILLVPETDSIGAAQLAESIRILIQDFPFNEEGQITCSFGISEFRSNKTKSELLRQADQALYESKKRGRNCITLYEETIQKVQECASSE
jgi:diguanylate cyclase (GGDEF)-like protein/PAS domain S-box-containing protein